MLLDWATCILEVIIVIYAASILMEMTRGRYTSDPSIAAAIGNAANRKFENSQATIMGISDRGMFSSPASNRIAALRPRGTFSESCIGLKGNLFKKCMRRNR
jgi:hypothetical protein